MACVSGTNIVNDGLVFHFDLENGVKSFKGKPTSNLLGGTNLLTWSGTTNRTTDTTVLSETYKGGTIWHLEDADGVNPDVSTDNYYMYNSYGPVVNGEKYTFSLDVKVLQKSNIPNGGASNSIWIWYAGSTEYLYLTNLPLNEWTRVHVTCTAGATYNYLIPRIDYDNNIIEIANIQFESGDIATKFTSGIRLDTASIIDLAPNKHTITAANLSYRQDDTPTFDGVNDYLSTPTLGILDAMSIEVWVYSSENKYASIAGDFSTITDSVGMRLNWRLQGAVWVEFGEAGIGNSVQTNVNINEWYHIVGIATNNDSVKMYINGQFIGSTPTTKAFTGGLPLYIGRGDFGEYFHGEISQVKIYNRALTATEIKQNFESTRSRYGI